MPNSRTATTASSLLPRALATAACCMSLTMVISACGGGSSTPRTVMVSERLLACDTLLRELRSLDYATATEAEMVHYMQATAESDEPCERLWMAQAVTRTDETIAAHQARQFDFQSRMVESAISARFDNRIGYCEILDEMFALLFTGLSDIEVAMQGNLPAGDAANLHELRELDLEALDVLVVHRAENCEE